MEASKPTYTQDEVNEILKRALAREASHERVLGHDDLVEIAAEVGIDREALARAMVELAQEQTRALARQGETAEIARERTLQSKRFGAALVSHAVLNGFLYFVCTRLTGGNWFVWPLLGSGVLLALQLRHVLFPYEKVERRRKLAERQRDRDRKRAERDAWKRRILGGGERDAEGAQRFETIVQAGVTALLAIAERKLAEHQAARQQSRRDRRG